MALSNRIKILSAGLLGLVASCATPQPSDNIKTIAPVVASTTYRDRLDSIYADFIDSYNSARYSHDCQLELLRDNGQVLNVFREEKLNGIYSSNINKMQYYIQEMKSLGAETHSFEILLETIR